MKQALLTSLLVLAAMTPSFSGADAEDYTLRFSESNGVVDQRTTIACVLDFADGEKDVSGWQFGVCHDPDMVEIFEIEDGQTLISLDADFANTSIFEGEGWTAGVIISFLGLNVLEPGDENELHVATYDLLEEGDAEVEYCTTLGSPTAVDIVVSDTSADPIDVTLETGTISIGTLPPFLFRAGTATGAPGETVSVGVELDNQSAVQAFSFGLGYDGELLEIIDVLPGQALDDANSGAGVDYFHAVVDLTPETGATVECIVSTQSPFDDLTQGTAHELAILECTIDAAAADGTTADLEFLDGLGARPIPLVVTVNGASALPVVESGSVEISGEPIDTGDPEFIRGDADGSGSYELFDVQYLMDWRFGTDITGEDADLECDDVGDCNDDGAADIQDVLYLLEFLFDDGPDLPDPAGECGTDPTDDDLDCEDQKQCE